MKNKITIPRGKTVKASDVLEGTVKVVVDTRRGVILDCFDPSRAADLIITADAEQVERDCKFIAGLYR